MVVSFKLSRRGRRTYPPSPAPAATAGDPPAPPTACPYGSPLPPPPPWNAAAARLDGGIAPRSDVLGRNGADPVDLDLEPSFVLNLFPDGYSVSEPGKGILMFMIDDDPKKLPYNKASKALLSDIEYGCLPQDLLHSIPCKFQNGTIVCEVRDYRPFLSNGGDSSEYDFPKLNRVALRLGTEYVVKDLSSIVDASWTYHDRLIAESTIINALQPRLNLDPTPCLEKLCNSVSRKIDLGVNEGRQQTRDTPLRNVSTKPPEKCEIKECDACEGAAVRTENAALEVFPRGILSSSSVNCASSLQVNDAKSTMLFDPEYTIRRSSALCDRKQSASCTLAPDHLLRSYGQRAEVEIVQVDHKDKRSLRETVLPQKRNKSSNLPCERHERRNCRSSNKIAVLSYQSSKGQFQKSMGTSNKLKLRSLKRLLVEAKVDHKIGNKEMRVQQQKPFSMVATNGPLPSSNRNYPCSENIPEKVKLGAPKEITVDLNQTIGKKVMRGQEHKPLSMLPTNCRHRSLNKNNLCVEKVPEKVHSSHIRMKERHKASIVNLDNHGVAELEDSTSTSVTSCKSSRKAAGKSHEDKASAEPQHTTSKRKVSGTSIVSLNQKINLKGKKPKKADTQIKQQCEDRSSVERCVTDATSSQLGIYPDLYPLHTTEPDIEKILSEVILTTQRYGLYGKAAKINGLETSKSLSSCSPSRFFRYERAEGNPIMWENIISCYPAARAIRRIVFHRVQYFSRGIVDQSHYILRLIESEALDDHQIDVETLFGNEYIHIATLPTSHHAKKFVDQFIQLMKRDGYILCKSTVCNAFSERRQQLEDVSQLGYQSGERPQYQGFYPCVARSVVINKNKDTGSAFQKRLQDVHANVLQQGSQPNVLAEQSPTLTSVDSFHLLDPSHPVEQQYNRRVLQDQGLSFASGECSTDLNQGFSPCVPKSVVINGSTDTGYASQNSMPDVHTNVLHQGSQQWVLVEQSPALASVDSCHLLDASHPVEKKYNSRGLQDQGLSFASGVCSMDANQGFSPCVPKSIVISESKVTSYAFQNRLPDVHTNVLQEGTQQCSLTEQSSILACAETFHFLNPRYPVEQQYNSSFLQDHRLSFANPRHPFQEHYSRRPPHDQGLSFASGAYSMDLDQCLSVEPSREVDLDQYFQCRHYIPGFSGRYGESTSPGSYDQWHQIPPQLSNRMCQSVFATFESQSSNFPPLPAGSTSSYDQWHQIPTGVDGRLYHFPAFDGQISNSPPLPDGWSIPLSASHPVGCQPASLQTTGDDVTSTPAHLLAPPNYQYLSYGIC